MIITEKITIKGLVQGIGYRPFVAKLAKKQNITGWVRNTDGCVTIIASGLEQALYEFKEELIKSSPKGAIIESFKSETVQTETFSDFSIIESKNENVGGDIPIISPDLSICSHCTDELTYNNNKRYNHAFISCTACGPRYSIIKRLPYDRENTVMDDFVMCDSCNSEYKKLSDIRLHAQTIACRKCGPRLSFNGCETTDENAINLSINLIKNGGILAVKDIGGYHLSCLPYDKKTVSTLRNLKHRENKPFAVLFPDLETIKQYCIVSKEEENILLSASKPIVLLKKKTDINAKRFAGNVGLSSIYTGAMLPCNPLQVMLSKALGPIIMTSANTSGGTLITDNIIMEKWLKNQAAKYNLSEQTAVLSHNRDILHPLDDSIYRVVKKRPQVIRRARGIVPLPVYCKTDKKILALGGDLKACFSYSNQDRIYPGQHLSDLANPDNFKIFKDELLAMKNLFGFSFDYVAYDMHPGYLSSDFAIEISKSLNCKSHPVQHHKAHACSILAEHNLKGKTICFTFDGTGYGEDGKIWGSEVFLADETGLVRTAHLDYANLIGGDEGAKNADTILLGYLHSLDLDYLVPEELKDRQKLVNAAISNGINTIGSSSLGRLFDAVSAFLDICHYNSYEGEAAIELENEAYNSVNPLALKIELSKEGDIYIGNTGNLFIQISEALNIRRPKCDIAKGFIYAVGDWIISITTILSRKYNTGQVALSGGSFLNRLLTEYVIEKLETHGFEVYINQTVPTGDGGICLGQTFYVDRFVK